MTTIPRNELIAIAERYGDTVDLSDTDPHVEWVRWLASTLRLDAQRHSPSSVHRSVYELAEADQLDALADRYEQKADAS
jgi:hypothetical protein